MIKRERERGDNVGLCRWYGKHQKGLKEKWIRNRGFIASAERVWMITLTERETERVSRVVDDGLDAFVCYSTLHPCIARSERRSTMIYYHHRTCLRRVVR